jgi:PAS domain S-box-containing protein
LLARSKNTEEIANIKQITIRSKLMIIILTSILPLAVLTGALNYAYVEQEITQGLTSDRAETNSINHIKYMTITSIVTVVTLTTLLSVFFAKSISIPILKLRDTSNEIAKGNLDVNMQVSTNDEIGQLASQFDMMRQNIKRSNEILVARTIELEKANQLHFTAEQKYKNLYEGSADLYRTINVDGIILDCNTSYAERLGYSKQELIGTSIFDTTAEVSLDAMHESFEIWKSTGHVLNRVIWLKRKDGTTFPALISATGLFDENGKLIGSNTVIKDISEIYRIRKELEEQNLKLRELTNKLEETNRELRDIDRMKDEFTSMVAHELKTPLVPIRGYCELFLDGTIGDLSEADTEKIQIIYNNALRLSDLISDFLDIQQLELGKMKFDKRETSARDLVDNCVKGLKFVADEKNINLQIVSGEDFKLNCDPKRLLQVLTNLVSNAIKFVPEREGKVEICARRQNGSVLFSVKDNGIGIPKEKKQNIFRKFYQVDSSLSRKAGGAGLGLAISKEIVEAHKGRIWMESEEGKGSTFYVSIPVEVRN